MPGGSCTSASSSDPSSSLSEDEDEDEVELESEFDDVEDDSASTDRESLDFLRLFSWRSISCVSFLWFSSA